MGARTVGRHAALGASVVCAVSLALGAGTAAADGGLRIEAAGPPSATPGSLVAFSFAVSADGDSSFAEPLAVDGALCQGPPVLLTKDGDGSPATLDPGDQWTYVCQVQLGPDAVEVRNSASVAATDRDGRRASATGEATTRVAGQAISPVAIVSPGRAALQGPTGCATSRLVTPRVTGRRIMQIAWFLDGRLISLRTKPDAGARWTRALRLRGLRPGAHRVRAVVQFVPESGTPARALALDFSRCRPARGRAPRHGGS
jgi:hypothetical protein